MDSFLHIFGMMFGVVLGLALIASFMTTPLSKEPTEIDTVEATLIGICVLLFLGLGFLTDGFLLLGMLAALLLVSAGRWVGHAILWAYHKD